jgi:hypothetical protein
MMRFIISLVVLCALLFSAETMGALAAPTDGPSASMEHNTAAAGDHHDGDAMAGPCPNHQGARADAASTHPCPDGLCGTAWCADCASLTIAVAAHLPDAEAPAPAERKRHAGPHGLAATAFAHDPPPPRLTRS